MPGSGAMGSSLGNWEFDSQTNHNADCIPEDDIWEFVDDLSFIEILNLINISLASHNTRQQVPNNVPTYGQVIPSSHLKSQQYIDNINKWTKNQEMIISEKKTKSMIVNFTNNYQYHTRMKINGSIIEDVDKI